MMNVMRWMVPALGLVVISTLAGCGRDEPKVYRIPKEDVPPAPPEPAAPAPAPAADATPAPAPQPMLPPPSADLPQLKYEVPAGWKEEKPSEMRVASFDAPGVNGQTADVSVIPLPVMGKDLDLVNMWRSRMQLPATSDPAVLDQAKPVAIGSEQGRLFEFVSEKSIDDKGIQRIVVAMLAHGQMSWFFKITGDDASVKAQKEKFLEFLKTVSFNDNSNANAR